MKMLEVFPLTVNVFAPHLSLLYNLHKILYQDAVTTYNLALQSYIKGSFCFLGSSIVYWNITPKLGSIRKPQRYNFMESIVRSKSAEKVMFTHL